GADHLKAGVLFFQGVIAENSVEVVFLKGGQRFAGGGAGYHLIAFTLQDQAVGNQDRGFIIHDQKTVFAVQTHGLVIGRSTRKTVPLPTRLLTDSFPPWFWMIPFTIHNPRPVPFSPLVVTKGSKM